MNIILSIVETNFYRNHPGQRFDREARFALYAEAIAAVLELVKRVLRVKPRRTFQFDALQSQDRLTDWTIVGQLDGIGPVVGIGALAAKWMEETQDTPWQQAERTEETRQIRRVEVIGQVKGKKGAE